MSSINSVTNEVQLFQSYVKKLSDDIKNVKVDWSDEKYTALSSLVSEIASESKGVMVASNNLSTSFKKFEKVSSQK